MDWALSREGEREEEEGGGGPDETTRTRSRRSGRGEFLASYFDLDDQTHTDIRHHINNFPLVVLRLMHDLRGNMISDRYPLLFSHLSGVQECKGGGKRDDRTKDRWGERE